MNTYNSSIVKTEGYFMLGGKGRLYSRVKPYVSNIEEIAVDYCITNQVIPVASRILSYFDVTDAELLKETKETEEIRSLMDNF